MNGQLYDLSVLSIKEPEYNKTREPNRNNHNMKVSQDSISTTFIANRDENTNSSKLLGAEGPELTIRDPEIGQLIEGRWVLGEIIGGGMFGNVHAGTDLMTGKQVAVKLETGRLGLQSPTNELEVYIALKKSSANLPGFAEALFYNKADGCHVLVMTRLGRSMQQLLELYNGRFSTTTILMIGIQVVTRIQQLHIAGYLHEDISTNNLVIGESDPATVYLVDFGISTKLYGPEATARGRRSDLLSLGIELIEMCSSWDCYSWEMSSSGASCAECFLQEVREQFQDIPEVVTFLEIVFECDFKEDSHYERLRKVLRTGLENRQASTEAVFEWLKSSERANPSQG